MKLDQIDYFSPEKLQQVIEQRFGQKIELNQLEDNTLNLFKESITDSIKSFESSMAFNKSSSNPRYMENKVLLDFIIKEQEARLKVDKVMGKEVELTDPQKPGVKTTVNTDEVDVDTDEQGKIKIKSKSNNTQQQLNKQLKPGQQVSMEDLDDEARNFVDYIQDQGYKIVSQGAGPRGISIEYTDRDGNTHQVDFKDGGITKEQDEGSKDDLEDIVAPEFKKVVHAMQQGMNKDEIKKKYPKSADTIDMIANDLKKVMEVMRNHFAAAQGYQIDEAGYRMSGKETAALRLLVGSENFALAKRAMEMAKNGKSVPANLLKGFMHILEKLDKFIKGGAGAVNRLNTLSSIVGEDYEAKLKKLLENEMETSEILLASQDIVDQITDMYEKIAELKSSAVLELVDRMANEMGQETADSFSNQINPTLQALEDALGTARKGAQDSVAIVKGEQPTPMADTGDDLDTSIDTDIEGDSDIEGDDFAASEPAAGGEEPAGRAER